MGADLRSNRNSARMDGWQSVSFPRSPVRQNPSEGLPKRSGLDHHPLHNTKLGHLSPNPTNQVLQNTG